MPERPHLKVVDPETGLLHDDCPNCQGLETEVRAWRTRYANLKRDKAQEARDHDLFPRGHELFKFWQQRCGHTRSKWTVDRFWQVAPILGELGMERCRLAIEGAAYDPATRRRRNGTIERFDSWELLWRNADKTESFIKRAPAEIIEAAQKRASGSDPKPSVNTSPYDPSSDSGILSADG